MKCKYSKLLQHMINRKSVKAVEEREGVYVYLVNY